MKSGGELNSGGCNEQALVVFDREVICLNLIQWISKLSDEIWSTRSNDSNHGLLSSANKRPWPQYTGVNRNWLSASKHTASEFVGTHVGMWTTALRIQIWPYLNDTFDLSNNTFNRQRMLKYSKCWNSNFDLKYPLKSVISGHGAGDVEESLRSGFTAGADVLDD